VSLRSGDDKYFSDHMVNEKRRRNMFHRLIGTMFGTGGDEEFSYYYFFRTWIGKRFY
jgi:hypothetical protein